MKNNLRIFGFMVALSSLIVILGIWISSELHGVVYFSAGEPNRAILYTEWTFIIISIGVIYFEFISSIREKAKVMYDPLV